MKKLYIILCGMIISINLFSQGKYGHVTPTTADFIRYGEIPVSLFTGKMSLNIPLYTYKDNDFTLPLNLTYNAEGFKPKKRSGVVGLDWIINAGGCITREVYGVPDEDIPSASQGQMWGYLNVLKKLNYPDKNEIWNLSSKYILKSNNDEYDLKMIDGFFAEYTPDLFLFNFSRHSGQFMINNQGKGQANNKGYKIDLSKFTSQRRHEQFVPESSSLSITTPDGYQYLFGGDLSAIEFSISFKPREKANIYTCKPTILAWHLKKIIAPNGRQVIFYYKKERFSLNRKSNLWSSTRNGSSPSNYQYTAVKHVLLDSIKIDEVCISFKKSVEKTFQETDPKDRFNTEYEDFNHANYQLDQIEIRKATTLLFSYDLKFKNKDRRRFLNSIKRNDNACYNFIYEHTSYPKPNQIQSSDYWGFWKRNNYSHSYSLLKKIVYPTKGYSIFEYEPHVTSKTVSKTVKSTNEWVKTDLIKEKRTIGGARIKKIKNYTEKGILASEKEYQYTNSIDNTNSSSGILYQSPLHGTTLSGMTFIYGGWRENYNIEEPHVGYSTVFEKSNENGYIKYNFTDYKSNPDKINSKVRVPNGNINLFLATRVNRTTSNSKERGLVRATKSYKKTSSYSVESESLQYPFDLPHFELAVLGMPPENEILDKECIVTFSNPGGAALCNLIYLKNHPITHKTKIIDGVSSQRFYKYNNFDLLQELKIIGSNQDSVKTIYTYPFDYTSPIMKKMKENNLLSYIVEEKQYRNKTLVYRKKNNYNSPEESLGAYINGEYYAVGSNPLIQLTSYSNVNSVLNPTVKTNLRTGVKTIYLWGYNYRYIVAEIVNSNYNDVKNIIGGKPEDFGGLYTNFSKLDLLRTALPHAQVTTYTYRPFIGMTSKTEPNGITIYYGYDNSGRLKEIYKMKNTNKQVIEKYDYHYSSED